MIQTPKYASPKTQSLDPPALKHLVLLALQNRPRLLALPPRHTLLTRIRELVHTLGLHLNTIPRLGGSNVVPLLNATRVEEVLVQVVDVLEDALLATDDDVVDGR